MTIHAIAVRTFLKKNNKLQHPDGAEGEVEASTQSVGFILWDHDCLSQSHPLLDFMVLRLSRLLSIVASCWYHTFIHEYAFLLTIAFEHCPC